MNRRSISGNHTEQVLQSQITNLQSNIVVTGTNVAVGPNALNILTTGTGNTAIGNDAGGSPYGVAEGSGNVMVGASAGSICSGGSNNTFLGSNTDFTPRVGYFNGSIALGSGAIVDNYNQLMVAPNVTAFNMAGLAASTGTGAGTILEFDLAGNILPTAGTYKTVASIDTAIAAVNAPYAFSWYQNTTVSLNISVTPQPLALWTASYFGDSGNMAKATTWTCPATGLWSFKTSFSYLSNTNNIAIYLQLLHNSSGVGTNINWFLNPEGTGSPAFYYDNLLSMTKGDTLEWEMTQAYNPTDATVALQFTNSTFVGLMIAPGYTAA
jgi:hypothetical protein